MKKINALLIAGALALPVGGALIVELPKEAKVVEEAQAAIGNNQLFVGGVDINTQTDKKVIGGSGYAQLSGTTLTLHDYTYNGPGKIIHKLNYEHLNWRGAILYVGTDNLTIKVEGTNSVTLDDSDYSFRTYGIGFRPGNGENSSGEEQIRSNTLTFTGDGSLYVKSGRGQVSSGIGACSKGAISFTGPTCTFSGATWDSGDSGESWGSSDDEGASSAQLRIISGNVSFIGDIGRSSIGIGNDKMYQEGGVLTCESRVSSGNTWRPYGIWSDEMIFNGGVAYVSSAVKDGIENGTLKVGPNMTKLVVTGARTAIRGLSTWYSKVEQEAYAWDNVEGTGNPIEIASGATSFSDDYKKIQIGGVIKANVSGYSGAYDGAEHSISVSVTKPSTGATVKYGTSAGVYNLTEAPKYSALGTHTTYYQITADDYETLTGSADVVIGKADFVSASVTLEGATPVYDGEPHTPVVSAIAETVDGCDYAFSYSTSQEGVYGEMPSFTDAGEHTVYWKVVADNHNDATGSFNYFIYEPYVTNPSVTLTSEPFIYDGSAKTPEVSTAGETGDSSTITFTYSKTETGTYGAMPSFTDAGEHTVYWKAEADNHETVTGSFVVVISQAQSSFGTRPTAVTGLAYTGSAQALVNAGSSETGTVMYRLGEEGEFSSTVPSATVVGEYKVYFYVKGDANHLDTEPEYVVVSIGENSKVDLNSAIDSGNRVYDILAESNPEAAEALKDVLDDAKAVQADPNVTVTAIDEATAALLEALVSSVTTLIDDIGEVKYNKESQEAIEAAREAYDLLPEEQKTEVGEEKLNVLVEAEKKYEKLKAAANNRGLPAGVVVLIVLLSILLVLCGAYVLLFFVFNKWIKGSNNPQRVFKLKVEGMRVKLLAMNFRIIERFECDVYNTREEALKK